MAASKIVNQTVVRGADWIYHIFRWKNSQLITLNMAVGATGYWRVVFHGVTSIDMAKDISAIDFQRVLENMTYIGGGNVVVTGSNGGPFTIEWAGDLSYTLQLKLTTTNTFTPLSTISVRKIPKDLTGYTGKLQVRRTQLPAGTLLASITETASADGQLIIDAAAGHVQIYVKSTVTNTWDFATPSWYDLFMISPAPITEAWIAGQMTLEEAVIV